MPMDSISMCSNTLYMSNIDGGSSLRWLQSQPCHNHIISTPHKYGDDHGNVLKFAMAMVSGNCCEVVKVLKEEKYYVTVEIKWDRECLRVGG